AADEAGAPNVRLIDSQSEPGGQQNAHGGDHTHEPALLVGGLEHHHGEADIGAILCHDRLHERALLVLGTGWGITAHLPVIVDRFDHALCGGAFGCANADCQCHDDESQRQSHCATASLGIALRHSILPATASKDNIAQPCAAD